MRIFISGGSSLGKSTLAQKLMKKTKLEFKSDIFNSIKETYSNFSSLSFEERQVILEDKMMEIMRSTSPAIYDRSIIDVSVWTDLWSANSSVRDTYGEDIFTKDDILIIAPTPSTQWYKDRWENFRLVEKRWDAYTEMCSNLGSTTCPEIVRLLTHILETRMKKIAIANAHTGVKVITCDNPDDSYDWQDQVLQQL